MSNLNIQLDDELHKKLKVKAVMSSLTLKDYIITELSKETEKEAQKFGI